MCMQCHTPSDATHPTMPRLHGCLGWRASHDTDPCDGADVEPPNGLRNVSNSGAQVTRIDELVYGFALDRMYRDARQANFPLFRSIVANFYFAVHHVVNIPWTEDPSVTDTLGNDNSETKHAAPPPRILRSRCH